MRPRRSSSARGDVGTFGGVESLVAAVDSVAKSVRFSGVVRVDRSGQIDVSQAYGLADRAHEVPNTVDTTFAIASGSKGLTALVVMALVERRLLDLTTTARSVLGRDLPLIDDDVTVEHLLAHRSGIGDYLDETAGGDIIDHVLSVSVHELAATEQFLPVLASHESVFLPDERFAYNNAGYVVLALVAERVSGEDFHDLVHAGLRTGRHGRHRVPPLRRTAGTRRSGLSLGRQAPDQRVPPARPRFRRRRRRPTRGRPQARSGIRCSQVASSRPNSWQRCCARAATGPRIWLRPRLPDLHATTDAVWLEGYDAGVSFASLYRPSTEIGYTVISNWSYGAWPLVGVLNQHLGL